MYEYKVEPINNGVSSFDIAAKSAGDKIAGEIEEIIEAHISQGWELHAQYNIAVKHNKGCLSLLGFLGSSDQKQIPVLVFKRQTSATLSSRGRQ